MRSSGFTLIELVIAVSFSAIIVTILFSAFGLINRVVGVADSLMAIDNQISIIQNQFEKDLSGVFVPVQGMPLSEQEKKQTKEPAKKLTKVFYSTNKEGSLSVLSFITNNPIAIYEKDASKPRIVRVVYRVQPNTEKKGSYLLIRQESNILDFDAYDLKKPQPIPGYELAHSLKNIKIDFKAPQEKKDKAIEFIQAKEWDSDRADKESKLPIIPQFATITISLWDNEQSKEYTVTFNCMIVSFGSETKSSVEFRSTTTPTTPDIKLPTAQVPLKISRSFACSKNILESNGQRNNHDIRFEAS